MTAKVICDHALDCSNTACHHRSPHLRHGTLCYLGACAAVSSASVMCVPWADPTLPVDLAALRTQVQNLVAVLKKTEWVGFAPTDDRWCPCCKAWEDVGHKADCEVDKVLKSCRGE